MDGNERERLIVSLLPRKSEGAAGAKSCFVHRYRVAYRARIHMASLALISAYVHI